MALLPPPRVSSVTGRHTHLATPATVIASSGVQRPAILKAGNGDGTRKSEIRVCCSSVKDKKEAARFFEFGEHLRLKGEFSTVVQSSTASSLSTKQSKEEEEKRNYNLNTGYAIRTLREEFPALFYKELNFDIYRDDIVFKDPLNTFIGIDNYKSIFWALRFHGRIFFRALWIDIVSVRQPLEDTIMVRWTVHGIPRVLWESRGRFDGTSEYKLDKDGKIYEHRVHNIALNTPPRFHVISVQELIQVLGGPSTPKPTYFEYSSSSMKSFMPLTGIRHDFGSFLGLAGCFEVESSERS